MLTGPAGESGVHSEWTWFVEHVSRPPPPLLGILVAAIITKLVHPSLYHFGPLNDAQRDYETLSEIELKSRGNKNKTSHGVIFFGAIRFTRECLAAF